MFAERFSWHRHSGQKRLINKTIVIGFAGRSARGLFMEERVGFKSDKIREEFFQKIKSYLGVKNWADVALSFSLSRTHFQKYQYGALLLPRGLFERMLSIISENDRLKFNKAIYSKPGNWGCAKGGKALYEKYPERFETRRLNGLRKLRSINPSHEINSFQELSKDLCEFVGAFIGDGYVANGKTIGIAGNTTLDASYFNYLSNISFQLFNLKGSITNSKISNGSYLRFNSKNLYTMFTGRFGFPKGSKAHIVKIPDEILFSNEEYLLATIRGIFDTDGCVFFDKRKTYSKPYPRITLDTVSKNLAEQVVQILENYFPVYLWNDAKRNSWHIEIYGHNQLEKWMKLIGFSNERHLNKIKKPRAGFEPATSTSLAT